MKKPPRKNPNTCVTCNISFEVAGKRGSYCVSCARKKSLAWRNANLDRARQTADHWRKANPTYGAAYMRTTRAENAEQTKLEAARYMRERRRANPMALAAERARQRLKNFLARKGFKKNCKTSQALGCTYPELLQHLEATWEKNYPGAALDWTQVHIDHRIPLASAKSEDEIYLLSHYTNLQLLTAADNLKKGDSV